MLGTSYLNSSCDHFNTVQEAVNAAKSDGIPGTVYLMGGKTFTENVVADKLKGVLFIGNPDGAGTTTINGSLTISNSIAIFVFNITVSGGMTISHARGAHQVMNVIGNVTVQGGKFSSAAITDGSGSMTLNTGLDISSVSGNISVSDISVSKAAGGGAFLNPAPGYSVTVNRSKFTRSGVSGLQIIATGTVTLRDITASRNGDAGVVIANSNAASLVSVGTEKTSRNHFDRNGSAGLAVSGNAVILAADITANKNVGVGAQLAAGANSIIVGTIRSKGSQFNRNGMNGLMALTTGAIVMGDISASRNGGFGASLSNSGGTSGISIGNVNGKRNSFDRNAQYGIQVMSSGPVAVGNISASRNGTYGALLSNSTGDPMTLAATKGRNTFDRNSQFGLLLSSTGVVNVTDISASRNGTYGAQIVTGAAAATLGASTSKLNNFDRNGLYGLYMVASTGLTVTDISASKNVKYGAYLSNTGAFALQVLTNHAKQNQFNSNGLYGLMAFGKPIDIHNTTASKNGTPSEGGFYLNSTGGGSATLTCSTAKSNPGTGIFASLAGGGTLFLKSTVPIGNGTNINLVGLGPIISTVGCPS